MNKHALLSTCCQFYHKGKFFHIQKTECFAFTNIIISFPFARTVQISNITINRKAFNIQLFHVARHEFSKTRLILCQSTICQLLPYCTNICPVLWWSYKKIINTYMKAAYLLLNKVTRHEFWKNSLFHQVFGNTWTIGATISGT